MPDADDMHWQKARLFPVTGIGGADEQERRATSALLSIIESVHEFGGTVAKRLGAPEAAARETYIEVPFQSGKQTYRPDGLIRLTYGKRRWVALVEVKTGHNRLIPEQVEAYVDIAHKQGFDAVITVSQEMPTTPGVHPVAVAKAKLHNMQLQHVSWSQIHTEILIQQATHAISDPDQAWILNEFLRYLREPKSGALDFDDMGPNWVAVRDGATHDTLIATSNGTLDVVRRFDQLLAFTAFALARNVRVDVRPYFSNQDLADETARLQRQAVAFAKTGRLTGSLQVPGAAATLNIVADLSAGHVRGSITIRAPSSGKPTTRVNWLLRQLQSAPADLIVSARAAYAKESGGSHLLKAVLADPKVLTPDSKIDVRSFTLTLHRPMGSKRGVGAGSFIDSMVGMTESLYGQVLEHLKAWVAPAPKVLPPQEAPISNEGESTATTGTVPSTVPDLVSDRDSDATTDRDPTRPGSVQLN